MRKIIFASLLLLTTLILSFTSVKVEDKEIDSKELMLYANQNQNFFSVDRVARQIITKDPLLLLIDLRTKEEFGKFSLPGAINIPMENLFAEENKDYLDQELYNAVFYSDGTTDASVALMLCKRKSYNNVYVMRGGLTEWVEKILNPSAPNSFDILENEKYEFRKGARAYFLGDDSSSTEKSEKPKKKTVVKRKKKAVSGGCG